MSPHFAFMGSNPEELKMRRTSYLSILFAAVVALGTACTSAPSVTLDTEAESTDAVTLGDAEEQAVLAFVNDDACTVALLDDDVGLDSRAARNIIAEKAGEDGELGTADDETFASIAELDAVSYVGKSALEKLADYAMANGYGDGEVVVPDASAQDQAVLLLVNDAATDVERLDVDAGLDARAARNIIAKRDGEDGVNGTADDFTFTTIDELDAVSYVGERALDLLRDYAAAAGYLDQAAGASHDVIFSPQLYPASHNAKVQELIESAEHTLDVAMYSFSDGGIYNAIEAAAARGVQIRFIFETANSDRKKSGDDLAGTRSARLENMGVNVRYVNKIMHHKYMIVDGPFADAAFAKRAVIATGSGNWSYGAATRYDENTVFIEGEEGVALAYQQEFDHLWNHSRDIVIDDTLPYIKNPLAITDEMIDAAVAGTGTDVLFTSPNFNISEGSTTFRKNGGNEVSDALVDAIENAQERIWIASGHLRLRNVSLALEAKVQENPNLDVRVLLDGQEYLSYSTHKRQLDKRATCLANATTATQERNCYDKGFLYSYQLVSAGIPVRYKFYSYRWHYTYAVQMHHKYLLVDDTLFTGSYNLSDNAEHNTFENVLVVEGERFANLIAQYEDNFLALWSMERDGAAFENLWHQVGHDDVIPLVFQPMALDWDEVTALKKHIRENCSDVNSEDFRKNPQDHTICHR